MARIVRLHETGGPEVLRIEEIEVRRPGAGEVRISVEAIGLNRSDTNFRAGQHPVVPVLPSLLGQEAAGRIESVGDGVTDFKVGDAVSVIPSMAPEFGTMGSLIIARAHLVIRHPACLGMVEAAALWAAYLTAYGGLFMKGGIASGDHVVITAASSSVGLAAIQLANLVGAIPIALTRDLSKSERLLSAGAHHVVATQDGDYGQKIRDITGGKGARLVFDAVAGSGIAKLAGAMAFEGCYVLYGILSGEPTPLPVQAAFAHHLTFRTFVLDPAVIDLTAAVEFIDRNTSSGGLRPIVDRVFSLDDVVESYRYLESNRQFGKIVVTP